MLPLLGDLIPYAVPVALSPLPIIAAVMLLLAPAGTRGGAAFLAGRFATLAALAFAVALLAARLAGPGPSDRGGGLRIALGLLLMLGAVLVWRRRPRDTPALPGWMRSIETLAPAGALRLGAIVTAANPKELALVAGAGMIAGSTALPAGPTLLVALIFAALASLGAGLPLAWALAAPGTSRAGLGAARDWLVRNNAIVMAAVLLILGAMLVGTGLEAL